MKYSVEKFFSHSPKNFRGRILYCCSNFGYLKSLDKKGGKPKFSVEIFLSHSAEKCRRGILYRCSNFGYRKSLDKKGGVSRFCVEKFCHSAENFRRRGGETQLQQEGEVTFCKHSRHKIDLVHKDVKTFSTKWLNQK